MVGYWFYKFEVEDRDIGTVDYTSFKDDPKIIYPAASLCFAYPHPFSREKIALIDACRTVWKSYKKKDAPKTFQGETHKFTNFVNDIIDEVFEYDFDARRAIDAYQNRK